MEKRKAPRHPVQCFISFSGDHIGGEGLVVDVSGHGCSVESDKNAKEGTYLTRHVSLPDEASALKVDLAVVRWAKEKHLGWNSSACNRRSRNACAALSAPSKRSQVTDGFLQGLRARASITTSE